MCEQVLPKGGEGDSKGVGVYEERQKLVFCPTNHPYLPFGVVSAVPLAELRLHFFSQEKKVQKKHLPYSIFL